MKRKNRTRPSRRFCAGGSKSNKGQRSTAHVNSKQQQQQQEEKLESLEAKYSRLGTDDAELASSTSNYPWHLIPPRIGLDQHNSSSARHRQSQLQLQLRLPLLQQLCAEQIAYSTAGLTTGLLRRLPWRIAKKIWESILFNNMDSFDIYAKFALIFGHSVDFRSHAYDIQTVTSRAAVLRKLKVPQGHYRMDCVPGDVSVDELAMQLARVKHRVVLDIRDSSWPREAYFNLYNVPNLYGLSFNHSSIDDSFLYNLGSALVSSCKLARLEFVKIHDTKVTAQGVQSFLNLVSGCEKCQLSYVQSDYRVSAKSWSIMDDTLRSSFKNQQIGMAFTKMLDAGTVTRKSSSSSSSSAAECQQFRIVDVCVMGGVSPPYSADKLWAKRARTGRVTSSGFINIRRPTSPNKAKECPSRNEIQPASKKRKVVKTSARDYFGI
ncbi:uncharacterized protein LODBEIA_P18040 [Lodderomyces beijingensis]|uniref:Uncharacterized protein n=1 Tax=Lodderomyces beijingensis TaxID=1775926 RepID=A0ABP0ZK52_9ASCO